MASIQSGKSRDDAVAKGRPAALVSVFFLFACMTCVAGTAGLSKDKDHAVGPLRPFPQHAAYAAGSIKPGNRTQAEMDTEVSAYYDRWKKRYLDTVTNTVPVQKYLNYNMEKSEWVEPANAVCVSEAQGYAMLTVAAMAGHDRDAKQDFDALYRFYRAHPSKLSPDLMGWQQVILPDGRVVNAEASDSALDGDMDIAYSLLMADNQWGSAGAVDYRKEALRLLDSIMENEVNQEEWILLAGDWVKVSDPKEIKRFMVSTRSSDLMLSHLRTFAHADLKNSKKWMNVYNKTAEIINSQFKRWSPRTGLLADFIEKDKKGGFMPAKGSLLEGKEDGDYNWNACRVPWRLPIDYLLTGQKDIYQQLSAMNSWIRKSTGGDPEAIKPGYVVRNGKEGAPIPGRDYSDLTFIAPFAVAAMTGPSNQEWLDRLWDVITRKFPLEEDLYFANTIRMQGMLVVSGNWWAPE